MRNEEWYNKYMHKFMATPGLIKKPLIVAGAVILVVILGIIYLSRDKGPKYDFATIEKIDLVQEVNVTGKVKPSQKVDLSFEKAGRVASVLADVGDKVGVGQILVRQDNLELSAQLFKAQAMLEAEESKLDELKTGAKSAEIQVQEAKVANAKQDLVNKIKDAYTKSDDAVRNKVDQFVNNPKSANPQISFTVSDIQLETDVESQRVVIEKTLDAWKLLSDALTVSGDLISSLETAKANLDQVTRFLDKTALAVNSATAGTNLSQTTLDGYRTDVATARTNLNTATTNLTTAESTLIVAENELVLKKSGASPEQIATQEAKIKQAQADVNDKEAQLAKTILRSPIPGIVTVQDAKVGQVTAANAVLVSVISAAKFQVEAYIPEYDIANVRVGNSAQLTLEAYGPDIVFKAQVARIDPAETIIEGVTTYKTVLQFEKEDERIRSNMTTDITIKTAWRENVIAVPQRAIITKNGDKIVRVVQNNLINEVKVETGLVGQNGLIEIIQGLNEGDKIIIYEY